MQMTYSVRHGTAPAPLQQQVQDQVAGLSRFFERLVQADIILDQEGHRHIAEVRLHTSTDTHFARSEAADWRIAMDVTVDKLRRQLTRHKEKLVRRGPTRVPPTRGDGQGGLEEAAFGEPGGYQGGDE